MPGTREHNTNSSLRAPATPPTRENVKTRGADVRGNSHREENGDAKACGARPPPNRQQTRPTPDRAMPKLDYDGHAVTLTSPVHEHHAHASGTPIVNNLTRLTHASDNNHHARELATRSRRHQRLPPIHVAISNENMNVRQLAARAKGNKGAPHESKCELTRTPVGYPLPFPHCQRRPATAQPSHHGNNNEITKVALEPQNTRGGQHPALSRGRGVHTDGDTTSATPAASGASPTRKCFTRATISFRFPSTTGRSAKDPK